MLQEIFQNYLKNFQVQFDNHFKIIMDIMALLKKLNYPSALEVYGTFDQNIKSLPDSISQLTEKKPLKLESALQLPSKSKTVFLSKILKLYSDTANNLQKHYEINIWNALSKAKAKVEVSSTLFSLLRFQKFELERLSSSVTKYSSEITTKSFLSVERNEPNSSMFDWKKRLYLRGANYIFNWTLDSIIFDNKNVVFYYHVLKAIIEKKHPTLPCFLSASSSSSSSSSSRMSIASALDTNFSSFSMREDFSPLAALDLRSIEERQHYIIFKFSQVVCDLLIKNKLKNITIKISDLLKLKDDYQDMNDIRLLVEKLCLEIGKLPPQIDSHIRSYTDSWASYFFRRKLADLQPELIRLSELFVMINPIILLLDSNNLQQSLVQPFRTISSVAMQCQADQASIAINAFHLKTLEDNLNPFYEWVSKLPIEKSKKEMTLALKRLGYDPKLAADSVGGKQLKAEGSGFYFKNKKPYYLKHVTNSDFLADDLCELLVSSILKSMGDDYNFADCTSVKVENEVFVASSCFEDFKPLYPVKSNMPSYLFLPQKIDLALKVSKNEKPDLSKLLAACLWIGDYDCHPTGNIGRSRDRFNRVKMVKIDHGWGLENICLKIPMIITKEIDMMRDKTRSSSPVNNLNNYPFITDNPDLFLQSIDKLNTDFKPLEMRDLICEHIKELITLYSGSEKPGIFSEVYTEGEILKAITSRIGLELPMGTPDPSLFIANNIVLALEVRLKLMKIFTLLNKSLKECPSKEESVSIELGKGLVLDLKTDPLSDISKEIDRIISSSTPEAQELIKIRFPYEGKKKLLKLIESPFFLNNAQWEKITSWLEIKKRQAHSAAAEPEPVIFSDNKKRPHSETKSRAGAAKRAHFD